MLISLHKSLCDQDHLRSRLVRAVYGFIGVLLISSSATAKSDEPPQPRSFATVAQAFNMHFASLKDYKPGDLLSQSRIADALKYVSNKSGWKIPNQEAIVKRALADDSFLVTQLSTTAGRPFMRNIAKYNGSYSRIDRLSTISGGQQFIKDLIAKKGGSDMIEYLATTRGGHELGKMMAGAQDGVDLNKPTGRIYTADDLLVELQRVFVKTAL